MNPHLAEVAYILDRSSSMHPLQGAAIRSFNEFLAHQLDVPGDANLTLNLFSSMSGFRHLRTPIHEVTPLDESSYVPGGWTSLLDAIGETCESIEQGILSLPEEKRPAKVIVAIFTDGQENASRRYSDKEIREKIQRHREQDGWEFLFLAANLDAVATAGNLGIDSSSCSEVGFDEDSIRNTGMSFSRMTRSLRMEASNTMDATARRDRKKTLRDIVEEENPSTSDPT
jgi:hypothetical protein